MQGILPYEGEAGPPRLGEVPDPVPAAGEALVDVRATALNRADLLQMRGLYPPPPGESEVPGLECAGIVREVIGDEPAPFAVGDRVMALLAGGGHATQVAVPFGQLMPIPEELSFTEAAAIPEVGLTAWVNLVVEAGLTRGERVLITAAASGVGTFAVQVAHEIGATIVVAGRRPERLEKLRPLGAQGLLTLGPEMPKALREWCQCEGVDVVLDLAGGEHLPAALGCLAPRGRLVLVGLMAGARAELDLGLILRRRLRLVGSVLRSRSRAEKAGLVHGFSDFALDRLGDGRLRPVVDRVLPFEELPRAYKQLEKGRALGKIVIEVGG